MSDHPVQYLFADCQLEPHSRRLLRADKPVEVQNQVFDLLHYLVRHPQQIISKQQLLDEVWNNQFLTDTAITQAVKKARQAVGDDGQRQAVIKTVHGKGISLIAPVELIECDQHSGGQKVSRTQPFRPFLWMAPVLLVVLLGWWRLDADDVGNEVELGSVAVFAFENATGDPEFQWLEYGLAETTSLLLEQSGGVRVVHPDISAELPEGGLVERTAMLGADYGLTTSITNDAEQFAVAWELASVGESPVSGSFVTADASNISRQLLGVVLAELSDQPLAPVVDQPLLNDPLAVELYNRGTQALYQDDSEQAVALLSAALSRVPDSWPLQVSVAVASFDEADIEGSLQRYHRLLETLPETAKAERARLAYQLGTKLWFEGDVERASELLEQVLAETENTQLLRARALNSLSFVRQSQSNYDQAWEYAKQAEVLLRDIQDPYHLSMVLTNLGYLAEDLGRLTQAGQYHQQALEIRERYGFPSLIAASQYGLARIERRSGNFAEASRLLKQSLTTVTELELTYDRFDNLEEMAELRMHQQRLDEAEQLLLQARAIAEQSEDALGQAWSQQVMVRLKLRRGLADKAAFELIDSALESLVEMDQTYDALNARLERAQLLMLADKDAEAETLLTEVSQDKAIVNPVLKLHQRRVQAELIAKQQGAQMALAEYQSIVRDAREIGLLDMEAECAIAAGHLALAIDDLATAQSMLSIARAWSGEYYRTRRLAVAVAAY